MSEVTRCTACGAENATAESPQGLCPSCLLKLGLSDPALTISAPAAPISLPRLAKGRRWGVAAAVAVIAAAIAFIALRVSSPSSSVDVPVVRFRIEPPFATNFGRQLSAGGFAVSPDGKRVAFVSGDSDGKDVLWIRPLNTFDAVSLPDTDGASLPFWSPDSRFIGFFAQGKLKKIDIGGGRPQLLCDAPAGRGGTWSREGVILFASSSRATPREANASHAVFRVSAGGGTPSPATSLDRSRQETTHARPYFLPDSRHFIFSVTSTNSQNNGVYAASLDSGERKLLLTGRVVAIFADRHLLFVRNGSLMAQPFDAKRLELSGEARSLRFAENVEQMFSASDTGTLVYRTGANTNVQLGWFDWNGKRLQNIGPVGDLTTFSLSPDGRRVVLARRDAQSGTSDLWILDLQRDVTSRLTFDPADDLSPLWSPDGGRVAFLSIRNDTSGVYITTVTGGGAEELILKDTRFTSLDSWSADGRFIISTIRGEKIESELQLLLLDKETKSTRFGDGVFNFQNASFSPDGRWIAYVSDESGKDEIYVQAFPSGGKWQVSNRGGTAPKWRPDGRALFYVAPEQLLIAVPLRATSQSSVEFGMPQAMFRMPSPAYDVARDGRIAVLSATEPAAPAPIEVVIGWPNDFR